MKKEDYLRAAQDYMGIEEYILQLSKYRSKELLTKKDIWKLLKILKYVIPCLIAIFPYFITQKVGDVSIAISFPLKILAILGGIAFAVLIILFIITGGLKQLCPLLVMPFANEKRRKENAQNEAAIEHARAAQATLWEKMEEYARQAPPSNVFFHTISAPSAELAQRSRMSKYGTTFYHSDGYYTGIYGNLRIAESGSAALLDGLESVTQCTRKDLKQLSDSYWLFHDPEIETIPDDEKIKLYTIREIFRKPLLQRNVTTTTTSYDIERAVKDLHAGLDELDNQGLLYNRFGADLAMREGAEKQVREILAPTTEYKYGKRYLLGEDVLMMESGFVVFRGNKMLGVCIPRQTQFTTLTYRIPEPICTEDNDMWPLVPKEQEFKGLLTAYEVKKVSPNPYAVIDYLCDNLSKYLPQMDLSDPIPDGGTQNPEVWCYLLQKRFHQAGGKALTKEDCERLLGKKENTYTASSGTRVKMAVNVAALLLVSWSVLSVAGLLPDSVAFHGAQNAWNAAGEATSSLIEKVFYSTLHGSDEKKADNYTFLRGSYRTYINSGKDANITNWTEQCSGILYKKDLWYNNKLGILKLTREGSKLDSGHTETICFQDGKAMPIIATTDYLIGVYRDGQGQSFARFYNIERLDKAEPVDTALGWAEPFEVNGQIDFANAADHLYDILIKQDTERITTEEMAALVYFSAHGILLDYNKETAIFADDITDPDVLTFYRQSESGNREELHSCTFKHPYEGTGAGRFAVGNSIYYASLDTILQYNMETGETEEWSAEGTDDVPLRAINYIYGAGEYTKGKLCLVCLYDDNVTFLCPQDRAYQVVNVSSQSQPVAQIYANQALVYIAPQPGDVYNDHHSYTTAP